MLNWFGLGSTGNGLHFTTMLGLVAALSGALGVLAKGCDQIATVMP